MSAGTSMELSAGIRDRLKERLQGMMLDLLPAEVWDKAVEDAWGSFTRGPATKDWRGDVTRGEPELVAMLRVEMRAVLAMRVKVLVDCWATGEGAAEVDGQAKALLERLTGLASATILERLAAGCVRDAVAAASEMIASAPCSSCGSARPVVGPCPRCGTTRL